MKHEWVFRRDVKLTHEQHNAIVYALAEIKHVAWAFASLYDAPQSARYAAERHRQLLAAFCERVEA